MQNLCELKRAAGALASELTGASFDKAIVQGERALVVVFRRPRAAGGERVPVLLSVERERGRLSRLGAAPSPEESNHALLDLLRARLRNARLEGVAVLGEDRLAGFDFSGAEGSYRLLIALQGGRANVLLLDGDERILGALRPLRDTHRDLRPGGAWSAPTSAPRDPGADRFGEAVDDLDWFRRLEAHYGALGEKSAEKALETRIARALRKARQTLEKKRALLEADMAAAEEAAVFRQNGDRLKLSLATLAPDAKEVAGTDPSSGDTYTIALDPSKSPAEQMQGFYSRARKAERRAMRGGSGMADLEERETALAHLERAFLSSVERGDLQDFATADAADLLRRYAPKHPPPSTRASSKNAAPRVSYRIGKRELPRRLWPRRYRSADGFEIWVGRSDEGNDILSTRLAKGRDLFFHLDAAPGSHVILRTEGRDDPPGESLLDAAELAVHFSKGRNTTRAVVHIAPANLVRKPKGAKPGLVSVGGGRNLNLRRDEARLKRVLDARIDDD